MPLPPACPRPWQHCQGQEMPRAMGAPAAASPAATPAPRALLPQLCHSPVGLRKAWEVPSTPPTLGPHHRLLQGPSCASTEAGQPHLHLLAPRSSGHCPGPAPGVSQGSSCHQLLQRSQCAVTSHGNHGNPHGKGPHVPPSPRQLLGGDSLPMVRDVKAAAPLPPAPLPPAPLPARRTALRPQP